MRSGRPCPRPDGATDESGRVVGCYIHGLFHNAELRYAVLRQLAAWKGTTLPPFGLEHQQDLEYDRLAALVRRTLRMDLVYSMAGLEVSAT